MTIYVSEDFEGGSDGVDLSTSNTSSDLIGGTAPTFSSDAKVGLLSMRVNQAASTASSARFQIGTHGDLYVGFWIKSDGAWPTGNCYPSVIRTGSTIKTDFRVPSGTVAMRGGGTGQTLVWTAGTVLPTDTWVYVEHQAHQGAGTQRFTAYAEDGSVIVDSGSQAWAAASAVDNIVVGSVVAVANAFYRIDGLTVADESFAPEPTEPVVTYTHFYISGGVLVPMTVTPVSNP